MAKYCMSSRGKKQYGANLKDFDCKHLLSYQQTNDRICYRISETYDQRTRKWSKKRKMLQKATIRKRKSAQFIKVLQWPRVIVRWMNRILSFWEASVSCAKQIDIKCWVIEKNMCNKRAQYLLPSDEREDGNGDGWPLTVDSCPTCGREGPCVCVKERKERDEKQVGRTSRKTLARLAIIKKSPRVRGKEPFQWRPVNTANIN